jgi:hypothetical protein
VRVGILDGSDYSESDVGVTQGSVLTPPTQRVTSS